MKTYISLALAAVASANYSSKDADFLGYLARFGKSYGTVEEYLFRMELFLKANAQILAHNATPSTYVLGHNKYSDWTDYEFKRLLGHKHTSDPSNYLRLPIEGEHRPVDWVSAGAVTPVKD